MGESFSFSLGSSSLAWVNGQVGATMDLNTTSFDEFGGSPITNVKHASKPNHRRVVSEPLHDLVSEFFYTPNPSSSNVKNSTSSKNQSDIPRSERAADNSLILDQSDFQGDHKLGLLGPPLNLSSGSDPEKKMVNFTTTSQDFCDPPLGGMASMSLDPNDNIGVYRVNSEDWHDSWRDNAARTASEEIDNIQFGFNSASIDDTRGMFLPSVSADLQDSKALIQSEDVLDAMTMLHNPMAMTATTSQSNNNNSISKSKDAKGKKGNLKGNKSKGSGAVGMTRSASESSFMDAGGGNSSGYIDMDSKRYSKFGNRRTREEGWRYGGGVDGGGQVWASTNNSQYFEKGGMSVSIQPNTVSLGGGNTGGSDYICQDISQTEYHGMRRRKPVNPDSYQPGDKLGARGRYRCGRCGQLKTNHNCEFVEEASMCSTASQTAKDIIDPVSGAPFEGDQVLVITNRSNINETYDPVIPEVAYFTSAGTMMGLSNPEDVTSTVWLMGVSGEKFYAVGDIPGYAVDVHGNYAYIDDIGNLIPVTVDEKEGKIYCDAEHYNPETMTGGQTAAPTLPDGELVAITAANEILRPNADGVYIGTDGNPISLEDATLALDSDGKPLPYPGMSSEYGIGVTPDGTVVPLLLNGTVVTKPQSEGDAVEGNKEVDSQTQTKVDTQTCAQSQSIVNGEVVTASIDETPMSEAAIPSSQSQLEQLNVNVKTES